MPLKDRAGQVIKLPFAFLAFVALPMCLLVVETSFGNSV
jgi:hypothetical protein